MCEYTTPSSVDAAVLAGDILVGDHPIHVSRRKGDTPTPTLSKPAPPQPAAPETKPRPPSTSTGKRHIGATLYVGNLPYTQTGPSLQMFFDSYECDSICVRVTTDPTTGKSRGFGYVDFETREAAEDAMKKLKNVTCQGRKLRLDWTESRKR